MLSKNQIAIQNYFLLKFQCSSYVHVQTGFNPSVSLRFKLQCSPGQRGFHFIVPFREFVNLRLRGPCIVSIFQYISNKIQLYTFYLYLETALHISSGISTHHQEHTQLYLQHLVFVKPLLLLSAIAAGSCTI